MKSTCFVPGVALVLLMSCAGLPSNVAAQPIDYKKYESLAGVLEYAHKQFSIHPDIAAPYIRKYGPDMEIGAIKDLEEIRKIGESFARLQDEVRKDTRRTGRPLKFREFEPIIKRYLPFARSEFRLTKRLLLGDTLHPLLEELVSENSKVYATIEEIEPYRVAYLELFDFALKATRFVARDQFPPFDAMIGNSLGSAYAKRGHPAKAFSFLKRQIDMVQSKKVVWIDNEDAIVHKLAQCLEEAKSLDFMASMADVLDRVLLYYEKNVPREEWDSKRLAEWHDMLAALYADSGDYERSNDVYKRMIKVAKTEGLLEPQVNAYTRLAQNAIVTNQDRDISGDYQHRLKEIVREQNREQNRLGGAADQQAREFVTLKARFAIAEIDQLRESHGLGYFDLARNQPLDPDRIGSDSRSPRRRSEHLLLIAETYCGLARNALYNADRDKVWDWLGKSREARKKTTEDLPHGHFQSRAGSREKAREGEVSAMAKAAYGDASGAANDMHDLRRDQKQYLLGILPTLTERDQLSFLQKRDRPQFHLALSIALLGRTDPNMTKQSAEWALNGKAVAFDALTRRSRIDRARLDSAQGKELIELDALRSRISRLEIRTGSEEKNPKAREELEALQKREREFSRNLGQAGVTDAGEPWFELKTVQASIPKNAVLVEIARTRIANFKATKPSEDWQPERYLAWVIPATGNPVLIDLGPADAIDAAVAAVRKEFVDVPARLKDGEATLEKQLREKLLPLSRLVFAPINNAAGGSKRWIVCPDGDLWLLPWQILLTGGGDYAVQDFDLRYAITGRDLLAGAATPGVVGRPVILANPNYNLKLGTDPAAAPESALPTTMISRSLSKGLSLGNIPALPGTIAEAAAIQPRLAKLAGVEPLMLDKDAAVEAAVKSAKAPRVLHLSTHGFFLPTEIGDGVRLPENPLLRCGILVAGCNDAANSPAGADDGVLTGLEIVGMNLNGTDLVVLSACETALGDVHRGEGVAGLRQSFHLAGARSVVASAWQVPDDDTALLMVGLFDGLAAGKPTHESLREAQLDVIQQRRAAYNAAHPYYWAAFTVTSRR